MNIHWKKTTDSTNLDAWREKDAAEDCTVWCADYQTAGRGQRGSRWESSPGENLMFSVLFKPLGLRAADQVVLSQACAVGIARYLRGKGVGGVMIKWPNDIYIRGRKVCGMLLENTLKGDILAVCIAGIGLNISQRTFPSELPNPTSLLLALEEAAGGRPVPPPDPRAELPQVLEEIFSLYRRIGEDGRVPGLDGEYEALLYRRGELSEFEETEYFTHGAPVRFRGTILGVDRKTARLIVKHEDGRVAKYYFKEIRFVL